MTPKITIEMRKALQQHAGQPVEVEDDLTQKVYLLIEKDDAHRRYDQWLRAELQVGFDEADRGETAPLDMDEILDEAHRRHSNPPG